MHILCARPYLILSPSWGPPGARGKYTKSSNHHNPLERIKKARQLLELGEITQDIFNDIKASAMAEMGMVTKPPLSPNTQESEIVGGETTIDGPSIIGHSIPSLAVGGETKIV